MVIRIRRGLDLPISGVPEQTIDRAADVQRVAVVGPDYVGMKPTMLVQIGDEVKLGQPLFTDKKSDGVLFTSPGAGKIVGIHRGEKRVFQSIEIELQGDAAESFPDFADSDLATLAREVVRDHLVKSGLWTALRRRPYSKVPSLTEEPHAIFVQAIDTNPLAALPSVVINEHPNDFRFGLQVLARLTAGTLHVCVAPGIDVPGGERDTVPVNRVKVTEFEGPHPAGLPGTHIHFLAPASDARPVWYLNYQDVIAIGKLFVTGQLWTERVISLAGPQVTRPRLLRTRWGAGLDTICAGELQAGENRIVSGSVLSGRAATGPFAYLGRFHQQVTVLREGRDREFLGWHRPGREKFSATPVFVSALASFGQRFPFTTNRNGSFRAIVPTGNYERVMPLDIEPTFLLRALITGDTDQAQLLGALELDEEDIALLTYVDTGKHDFAPDLRRVLTRIECEG